jgi:hypothetical protein
MERQLSAQPRRAWAQALDYRREVIADEQLFFVKHLPLELDFGQADCDVVIRPLIVEVSNHAQRNNERADNCCCEGFHQAYSRLSFSTASPAP